MTCLDTASVIDMPKDLSEAAVAPPMATGEHTDENAKHMHNTDWSRESESAVHNCFQQDGPGELALSEATVTPPSITHDRTEYTEGVAYDGEEETQTEVGNRQEMSKAKDEQRHESQCRRSREHDLSRNSSFNGRQRREDELALTESTVSPPVTHDRQGWTEGDTYSALLHDEQARAEGRNMGRAAEEEEEGEERNPQPDEEKLQKIEERKESRRLSKHATHLYSVSYLVFFSIWGTLARLGLQSLTFYTKAPVVTGVLWANVAGCIVMGFVLEDRSMFKEEWGDGPLVLPTSSEEKHERHERIKKHKSVKKTIPLYIGLTTGFCGCLTSFSSFIRDIFLALSDDLAYPPPSGSPHRANGGYSFMAIIAVIATEVAMTAIIAMKLYPPFARCGLPDGGG